ncbi:ribonuclease P protein component [Nonlabens dokdonensis]|jgi:ribonuclease P protein component|uniref:Ribonuclease P protein component n=2 Tax=Nonlabens dokdonensis TaxID=328515 RepID=L7W9J6_NONDD|nr:ribonuclease P protein component [Nonlabens dokdonensis]AGC76516.1 ribonuclease P protein component [Nonlabens dokdonensis DSW-6]PZX44167.1 ribonuclease P protein component [Nonlabens dokdonensis]
MKLTLGRNKKLKSKKATDLLFSDGKSIRKGPLRVVYFVEASGGDHQIGVSVGKRFFKSAVDRNRVKRLMRESYRLHQELLPISEDKHLKAMFIYQSGKMPDYNYIEQLTKKLLKELGKKIDNLV